MFSTHFLLFKDCSCGGKILWLIIAHDRLDFEEVIQVEGVIFENCSKDKMFIQLSTLYLWYLFY